MKIHMIVVWIALIIGFMLHAAENLPMDEASPEDAFFTVRALDLMRLKGVGMPGNARFTSWRFPSTIVVCSRAYSVTSDNETGEFSIGMSTNSASRITGTVSRFSNTRNAMVCGFGELAMNNMTIGSVARGVSVRRLTSGSSVVHHARFGGGEERQEALVCKNMTVLMTLHSVSNGLDFACALLNAGLPVGERLTLPLSLATP